MKKIVVCVPAGREKYMRILIPYLVKRGDIVDRFDIWVNTDIQSDLDYINKLPSVDKRINLVYLANEADIASNKAFHQKSKYYQFNGTVSKFYPQCLDEDTMYIKLDDDICYIHDSFFERMSAERVKSDDAFLVMANMLNCPLTSKTYQDNGVIDTKHGRCYGDNRCAYGFFSGSFAVHLHKSFAELYKKNEVSRLFIPRMIVQAQSLRIGSMCFNGSDFAKFGGVIDDSVGDENFISKTAPMMTGKRHHVYCGDALVCHYAFSHQRAELEKNSMLELYVDICKKECGWVCDL